jgi:hypothetical protein
MPEENLPEIYDADRAASEFLIYQTENGESRVQVRLFQQSVWLTQKLIADLFEKSVTTINEHIRNIYEEKELDPEATIRKFRIVQMEGGRSVLFAESSDLRRIWSNWCLNMFIFRGDARGFCFFLGAGCFRDVILHIVY